MLSTLQNFDRRERFRKRSSRPNFASGHVSVPGRSDCKVTSPANPDIKRDIEDR
jgi:hypothetical protein